MIQGRFAEILEAGREAYNARFRAARQLTPNLDPDRVLLHLADTLAPIVGAVAGAEPERAAPVAECLFDLSLDLIGRAVIGPEAHHPVIGRGWDRLLAGLPHLTAADPEAFAGAVTNALTTLSRQAGARPAEWIERMARIGPRCTTLDDFLACGQVAAWRAGMAHYRLGALEVCGRLDPELAADLLDLPSDRAPPGVKETMERLRADPWFDPAGQGSDPRVRAFQIVKTVGGFRGFGGPFLTPPRVARRAEGVVVTDAAAAWTLHGDRFGATLLRTDGSEAPAGAPAGAGPRLDADGTVAEGRRSTRVRELAGASSWCADGPTLAVTIPLSHQVFLVAAAGPS